MQNKITPSNISLKIHYGDITEADDDVIVNAANTHLQHDGGVARAISDAAGPIVRSQSKKWVETHGTVPVGESAITGPGGLNATNIIHTVGPTNEQFIKNPRLLFRAFTSALETASKLRARTVAMPLISSGKCY